MEALRKDTTEELNFSMLIAMKGLPSTRKSEIATKLAEFLKYPLIDEDDIVSNLNTSPSNFYTNFSSSINEIPFKILTQITSTQLRLKLHVIINTSLSQQIHFDQLSHLATSNGACLIIIDCGTQIDQAGEYYNIKHVPKINIDHTKLFEVENVVPIILDVAQSYKSNFQLLKGKQSIEAFDHSKKKIIPQRLRTQAHTHEFSFIEEHNAGSIKFNCNYCNESISSPTYKCVECCEFILHKSCAELSDKLETLQMNCPNYLTKNPPEYNFPKTHKCNLCEQFSSNCNDCLFQTFIKSGLLPTILEYEKHIHKFNFVIMPLWFNYDYKCFACNKFGKFVGYKCYECNLDLHISCAMRLDEARNERKIKGPENLVKIGREGFDLIDKLYEDGRRKQVHTVAPEDRYPIVNPYQSKLYRYDQRKLHGYGQSLAPIDTENRNRDKRKTIKTNDPSIYIDAPQIGWLPSDADTDNEVL
ncbi:uncharacterized protein LOC126678820 [Mercurialis annua]|uniref:uncharacterized protein LOC126678820 n=1 Tax=Mercurialis annua TaxID=3986 RepID=UPI00215F744C|nr:uncharacterized protein LOC126678820 [Mercurialis annua]